MHYEVWTSHNKGSCILAKMRTDDYAYANKVAEDSARAVGHANVVRVTFDGKQTIIRSILGACAS